MYYIYADANKMSVINLKSHKNHITLISVVGPEFFK